MNDEISERVSSQDLIDEWRYLRRVCQSGMLWNEEVLQRFCGFGEALCIPTHLATTLSIGQPKKFAKMYDEDRPRMQTGPHAAHRE